MAKDIKTPKDLPARALEVLNYLICKKAKGCARPSALKIRTDLAINIDYPMKVLKDEGVVALHIIKRAHHFEVLISRTQFNKIKVRTNPKIKQPERAYYRPKNNQRPFPADDPRWPADLKYEDIDSPTAHLDKTIGKAHVPSKSYHQTLGGSTSLGDAV